MEEIEIHARRNPNPSWEGGLEKGGGVHGLECDVSGLRAERHLTVYCKRGRRKGTEGEFGGVSPDQRGNEGELFNCNYTEKRCDIAYQGGRICRKKKGR